MAKRNSARRRPIGPGAPIADRRTGAPRETRGGSAAGSGLRIAGHGSSGSVGESSAIPSAFIRRPATSDAAVALTAPAGAPTGISGHLPARSTIGAVPTIAPSRAAPGRQTEGPASTVVRRGPDPAGTPLSSAPLLARTSRQERLQLGTAPLRVFREMEPQALSMTYWFDAPDEGEPFEVSVRFTGRRLAQGESQRESFQVVQKVDRIPSGSGRVALTSRVNVAHAGTWQVTAAPLLGARGPAGSGSLGGRLPRATASGISMFEPLARNRAPGARLSAWPLLVTVGAASGLALQAWLASRLGLPAASLALVSLMGCLMGLAGAKVYYLLTHRTERFSVQTMGMSVQGFVLTALAALAVAAVTLRVSAGTILDVSAPGLLTGLAIGRIGCLLGGCCVGRPTGSRWGVWSSDRAVGVRRIPVQLMESALAGVSALVTFLVVAVHGGHAAGAVFVAGFGTYLAGRQLLFPLRGIPRVTAHGRQIVLTLSVLAVLAAAGVLLSH